MPDTTLMAITKSQRACLSQIYEIEDAGKSAPSRLKEVAPKLYAKVKGDRSHITKKMVFDIMYPDLADGSCEHCQAPTKWQQNCWWSYAKFCSTKCANKANNEARAKTVLARYGVSNVSKMQSIKDQKAATCMENHGVLWPQQAKAVRDKSVVTNMRKYGVANVSSVPEVQAKREVTMIERFGVANVMHNPAMLEHTMYMAHRVKKLEIGGKTFNYMGYENVFIQYLVDRLKVPVKDITTKAKHMPPIWYFYRGRTRKYTPDVAFKYKGKKWIVEVKSTWTAGLIGNYRHSFNMLRAKARAATSVCKYAVALVDNNRIFKFDKFDKGFTRKAVASICADITNSLG